MSNEGRSTHGAPMLVGVTRPNASLAMVEDHPLSTQPMDRFGIVEWNRALSEYAARVCYRSQGSMGKSPNFLARLWGMGHYDVFEHGALHIMLPWIRWAEELKWTSNHLYPHIADTGLTVMSGNVRAWTDAIRNLKRQGVNMDHISNLVSPFDPTDDGVWMVSKKLARSIDLGLPIRDDEIGIEVTPLSASIGLNDNLRAGIVGPAAAGHSTPPIHHHFLTVEIAGLSRSCTHQLVRHRLASFSQESQRYVDMREDGYMVPPSIRELGGEAMDVYVDAMENLWQSYQRLRELGARKEDARFVLPNAARSRIVVTMPVVAWNHFIKLRAAKDAQWEIRMVANAVRTILGRMFPSTYGDDVHTGVL